MNMCLFEDVYQDYKMSYWWKLRMRFLAAKGREG